MTPLQKKTQDVKWKDCKGDGSDYPDPIQSAESQPKGAAQTAEEWAETQRSAHPEWFPNSHGRIPHFTLEQSLAITKAYAASREEATQQCMLDQAAEELLDAMVRDFCAVGPKPKSEVRRRIVQYAASHFSRSEREQAAPTPTLLHDLVFKARAKRTIWLRQHGVPISQEFAEFADAIGELINACELGTSVEPSPAPKIMLSKDAEAFYVLPECPECGGTGKVIPKEGVPSPVTTPRLADFDMDALANRGQKCVAESPVPSEAAPTYKTLYEELKEVMDRHATEPAGAAQPSEAVSQEWELKKQIRVAHNVLRVEFGRECSLTKEMCDICCEVENASEV
jgi:hypothetical protein